MIAITTNSSTNVNARSTLRHWFFIAPVLVLTPRRFHHASLAPQEKSRSGYYWPFGAASLQTSPHSRRQRAPTILAPELLPEDFRCRSDCLWAKKPRFR